MRLMPLNLNAWPDEKLHFGIAIMVSNRASQQLHVAALYRSNGNIMIGDVQTHLQARRTIARPNERWKWIALDLSQEDQKILAATVDSWLELNPDKIPYSVAHPGGVIFKDNVWVGNTPGQGLTCATFVVELFNELGIPFIAKDTWLTRPDDDIWAKNILGLLAANMPAAHVKAQYDSIGKVVRVRPSDVAAAAHLVYQEQEDPFTFEQVSPLALSIEKNLLEI
jgi:hypothetical protein